MAEVTTREGSTMTTNHEFRVNLWNFNLPQIVTTILAIGAAAWAGLSKVDDLVDRLQRVEAVQVQSEQSYASRRAATDERFKKIEDNMEPMGALVFRVQQLEQATNKAADATDRQTNVLNDMRVTLGVVVQRLDGLAADKRASLTLDGPPSFRK